jgi:hypothetical protein
MSTVPFDYFFVDGQSGYKSGALAPNLVVPPQFWYLINYTHCRLPLRGDLLDCGPRGVGLMIIYLFCFHYALYHTNAHWIIRLADDTLVNFASLGKMISSLDSQHNPLVDVVFKAHCLDVYLKGRQYGYFSFPQGGSGFVVSRHACKLALDDQISILKHIISWDDYSTGYYLHKKGFPSMEMGNSYFIGRIPQQSHIDRFLRGNLTACTNVRDHARNCGKAIAPLRELVFFHLNPFRGMDYLMSLGEKLFNADSRVFWWNGAHGSPGFCIQKDLSL